MFGLNSIVATLYAVIVGMLLPVSGSHPPAWNAQIAAVPSLTQQIAAQTLCQPPCLGAEYLIPTPNALANSIVAGLDGNLWFTEYYGNKIGKITINGRFTEFTIPTAASGAGAIAAGPGGNIWFAENNSRKIGKITPAGMITEYPFSASMNVIASMTAGSDGNLWGTENAYGVSSIVKIAANGAFTQYPLPSGGTPSYIVAGADGNLWFTEPNTLSIGRITTSGGITEFQMPQLESPQGIAAGPDGNLWITQDYRYCLRWTGPPWPPWRRVCAEWQVHADIGRVTTHGAVTEFRLPIYKRFIDITAGPDGNLWFEADVNKIGKITPRGGITEYVLPAGIQPFNITKGPDGKLWFIDYGANKIANFIP